MIMGLHGLFLRSWFSKAFVFTRLAVSRCTLDKWRMSTFTVVYVALPHHTPSNLGCYSLRRAKKLTITTICSKRCRGLPNNNQWSRRYRWNQLPKIAILVWAVIVCWVRAADELSDFSLYVVNVCEEFSLAVLIHQMCRISFQRCSKLLVLVSFFALGVHGKVGLSSASLCRC